MRVILLILIGLSLSHAELTRDPATGIVSDSATGLEWQDNAVGSTMTWTDAIDTCENLTLGGKSDWRLPNINELKSIVDRSKAGLAIKDGFENTTSSNDYWSSTTIEGYENYAWSVNFLGYGSEGNKDTNYYVRCVRDGQ